MKGFLELYRLLVIRAYLTASVVHFVCSLESTVAMKALKLFVLFQVLEALQANPIVKNITHYNDFDEVDLSWRLPKTIYPISYQIELETRVHDLGERGFSGQVGIDLDIREPTEQIILHSKGLKINEVFVFDGVLGGEVTFREDETRDFLIIEAGEELLPGDKVFLYIDFTGELQLQGVGFYRTEYKIDGETRYLAATQFEANFARYAFPVFDGRYSWHSQSTITVSLKAHKIYRARLQSNVRAFDYS